MLNWSLFEYFSYPWHFRSMFVYLRANANFVEYPCVVLFFLYCFTISARLSKPVLCLNESTYRRNCFDWQLTSGGLERVCRAQRPSVSVPMTFSELKRRDGDTKGKTGPTQLTHMKTKQYKTQEDIHAETVHQQEILLDPTGSPAGALFLCVCGGGALLGGLGG